MRKLILTIFFITYILSISFTYGQVTFIGLETKLTMHPRGSNLLYLNPESQIIDNYIYVPTYDGIYRKNLNEINNLDWELYGFKGVPVRDFVKNKSYVLAITTKSRDSLILLSTNDGVSLVNHTSNFFFKYEAVNTIWRVSMNPLNPKSILVLHNNYGIAKSTDFGNNWTSLNELAGGYQERFVGFNPDDTTNLFYAGETGFFQSYTNVSYNNGESWSLTEGINNNSTHYLAFNPTDPNIILAAGEGRISKSNNKGKTWNLVTLFPDYLYVTKIIFDVANPNIAYATGYLNGKNDSILIYKSVDAGNSWFRAYKSELEDNGGIIDFQIYQDILFLITFNKGVYKLDMNYLSDIEVIHNPEFKIYPNPTSSFLYFESSNKFNEIEVVDLCGKVIKKFNAITENKIDLSGLVDGVYFVSFYNINNLRIKKKIQIINSTKMF